MQLMTHYLGGKVEAASQREYGKANIQIQGTPDLFKDLPEEQVVWMSHGDLVVQVPEGFTVDATSHHCPNSAMSKKTKMVRCSVPSGSPSFRIRK